MKVVRRKTPKVHRGNMLLQLAIVMAIVLAVAPGAMDRYAGMQQEKVWSGTASHLSFVAQAAKRYVRDNRNTLLTKVASAPVVITGDTLRSQGYLPAGFSLTNDSGQTYQLAVAKDPGQAGQLVAFVLTTGGNEIPFKGLRQIAADTDGMGGYVWPANTAVGADGGWQAKLSDYGLSGQQGRLAAFLSADALGTDADESDRLYRYQVTGRPDLNRMHTAIDMNGNDINNGGVVNAGKVFGGTVSSEGNLTAGGVLELNKINSEDEACDKNGNISRNAVGASLSCINRIWKLSSITDTVNAYGGIKCDNQSGQSIAYCPNGYRLLSGGYALTSWGNDNTKRNSPDSSYPNPALNAWIVTPPGSFGGCGRAVALCGK